MTSPSKRKGSAAELAFVKYLKVERGYSEADRRLAGSTLDKGDVSGVPGVTFEVKNHKAYDLAGWLKELDVEQGNAGTHTGVVIVKRAGIGWPGGWYAVLDVERYMELLDLAGYGPKAPWARDAT